MKTAHALSQQKQAHEAQDTPFQQELAALKQVLSASCEVQRLLKEIRTTAKAWVSIQNQPLSRFFCQTKTLNKPALLADPRGTALVEGLQIVHSGEDLTLYLFTLPLGSSQNGGLLGQKDPWTNRRR